MSADFRTAAESLVKRTCAAQGLAEKVADPAVLARVASLLVTRDEAPPKRGLVSLVASPPSGST